MFRADAAFAEPEIYEALEERGMKYAQRRHGGMIAGVFEAKKEIRVYFIIG